MNEKRYPVLSKLLSKKVKSASQVDVDELARLEKELASVARRVGRVVKGLENYVQVPTKIHLIPADLLLFSSEVMKSRMRLEDEISKAQSEALPEPEVADEP